MFYCYDFSDGSQSYDGALAIIQLVRNANLDIKHLISQKVSYQNISFLILISGSVMYVYFSFYFFYFFFLYF